MGNDTCFLSIAQAADLLRRGDLSPVHLTQSVLNRINETEKHIVAYSLVMGDEALRAAGEAEASIGRGEYRGALHGIPIAIKDNIYTLGALTQAGSDVLQGFVPTYDATVTKRLRDAGAIIIGKTVTHEFAYRGDVPPTRNPWDVERTPGGSSAGSAAAVAAHSCMAAIGTETQGSTRMPAAVNGVVGLKPTYGRISRYGVIPLSWSLDHCGLLTKTVIDAAIVLNAVAGFDPNDPTSARVPVSDYTDGLTNQLSGMRIGVPRNYFFRGLHSTVRQAVDRALRVLEELGAILVPVTVPEVVELSEVIANGIMVPEASSIHRAWVQDRADLYDPGTRLWLEFGEFCLASYYLRALQARTLVKNAFKSLFTENSLDALAAPMEPSTATLTEESLSRIGWDRAIMVFEDIGEEPWHHAFVRLSVPTTLAGLPGLTVLCGFSTASPEEGVGGGLPIGLQIIGRPFDEAAIFRIGHAYQTVTDWHLQRPPL